MILCYNHPDMGKSLLVLAAGMGSRYGGLKQMDPVGPGGEFICDYSVAYALAAGFDRVVFLIRRDIEGDFREIVGKRWEGKADVAYAFQAVDDVPKIQESGVRSQELRGRTKPWGTGHAVYAARDVLGGDAFVVVNADDFYGEEPFGMLAKFLDETEGEPNFYAMAAYRLDQTLSDFGTVSRGVCRVGEDGMLLDIREILRLKREADGFIRDEGVSEIYPPETPVSMNLFAFKRSYVDMLEVELIKFLEEFGDDPKKEFYMPVELGKFVREGRAQVRVMNTSAEWAGITSREDREIVMRKLKNLTSIN